MTPPHTCTPAKPCALCGRDRHLIPGGTPGVAPAKPTRGACAHLGRRVEFRPGCNGRLCRHECEAGEPEAVPGGVCQLCPKWEARYDLDATAPATATASHTPDRLPATAYLTAGRLAADAERLAGLLPPTVDGVVGCARSGLVPAAIVASHLHLPLWSFSKAAGVVWVGGGGRTGYEREPAPAHLAVVDDTIALGREMGRAVAAVRKRWSRVRLTRAVIYAIPDGAGHADVALAEYPGSHFLSWNYANAGHGVLSGWDFDGVLCEDIAPEDDAGDDHPRYRAAVANARPLHLPRRGPVPLVVTMRPVAVRGETEDWLKRWGVKADRLVMRDFPRPGPAEWVEVAARFKAAEYSASGLPLFVESDPPQAERIAAMAGRPVLCPAAGRVFGDRLAARDPVRPPVIV